MTTPRKEQPEVPRVTWTVQEWRKAVGFSHTVVSGWIKSGHVASAKFTAPGRKGGARRIIESPEAFVERHRTDPAAAK